MKKGVGTVLAYSWHIGERKMNVFKRLGNIISSNVNSVLDKMEDPEKMIDLSISELKDTIAHIRSTISEKKAELERMNALLASRKEGEERWASRAKLAAGKGEDGMAREAIAERQKLEKEIKSLSESIEGMKAVIASLEASLEEAKAKLSEMKESSALLKARARQAKERIKVSKVSTGENSDWSRRLEEMKARIDRLETEADITWEEPCKAKSFRDLEEEEAIEKELQALKEAK